MFPEDDSNFNLDRISAASVKKILLQTIIFKGAKHHDEGEMLRTKYKALNTNYKPGRMKSSHSNKQPDDDLPVPQVILFREEKLDLFWKDIRRIGPGLANRGNTCFLNSVLQVLTYTPPLVNYILSGFHQKSCHNSGFCMQCELTSHFKKVFHNQHGHGGVIVPNSIIQKLKFIGKNFKFGRQEDSHEFLRYVVEAIQKSDFGGKKLDKVSKETTVANAIFGGYYRSQVKCFSCQHESNTYDPMMDINLDIKECSSIIHAFKRSVYPDKLDGDNKYFCERCRKKTIAHKRGTIHKEPNVLTLQLKRFDFSKMFGGKISKEVHFPEELNIRPYMSNTKLEPVFYKLYGVLVHAGYSCNSGHYYCYVKGSNGIWYEMNDNRVTQVSLKTVMNAQAYLLFYIKAKKSSPHQNTSTHTTSTTHQQQHLNNSKLNASKLSDDGLYGSQKHLIGPQRPVVIGPQKPVGKSVPLIIDPKKGLDAGVYGTVVKRKPEAKIVLNIPKKQNLTVNANPFVTKKQEETKPKTTAASSSTSKHRNDNSSLSNKADKHKNDHSNTNGDKKSDRKPKATSLTVSTEANTTTTTSTLNSLQKIGESYCDTDSSSAPSSPPLPSSPTKTVKKKEQHAQPSHDSKNAEEKTLSTNTNKSELSLNLEAASDGFSSKDEQGASSSPKCNNNKATAKQHKHNHHHTTLSRNSIWSPVTKGTLQHKIFFNRHNSSTSQASSTSPSKRDETLMNIDDECNGLYENHVIKTVSESSSPKESRVEGTSATQESRENGIPSSSSIDITTTSPRKHERSGSDEILSREKKSKKKSKKKKKKKHKSSAPASPLSEKEDVPEMKKRHLFVDASESFSTLRATGSKRSHKRPLEDDDLSVGENIRDLSPKKKKKRKKSKERHHEEETREDSSSSSDKKKKKKKKHHKRKHQEDDEGMIETSVSDSVLPKSSSSFVERGGKQRTEKEQFSSSGECSRMSPVAESTVLNGGESSAAFGNKDHSRCVVDRNYNGKDDRDHDEQPKKKRKKKHRKLSASSSNSEEMEESKVTKPRLKKEVPVHLWDDEKKKSNTWDGAANKSNTIQELLNGSTKVSSWEGTNDNTDLYSLKNHQDRERNQDDWDEEYDAGKTKKVKKKPWKEDEDKNEVKINIFQRLQDFRYHTKDNTASFRRPSNHGSRNHHQGDRRHSGNHHHGNKNNNGGNWHNKTHSKHNKTIS